MSDEDDDLAERVGELEAAIEDLRDELREPPSGPFGLPRPPSPGEVLRFTDEYALPTMIAVLEANLRALKLLQRVLRATRGVEESDARERARDLGRDTLDRIDDALADLSTAMADADLPRDPEARDLLEDVREVNEEVRERLEANAEGGSIDGERSAPDDASSRGSPGRDHEEGASTRIDVEAELESIKEEVRGDGEDRSKQGEGGEGSRKDDGADGGSAADGNGGKGTDGQGGSDGSSSQ